MHIMKNLVFILSSLFIISCGTSNSTVKEDPLLKEAFGYHKEAIEVQKSFKANLKELENRKNGIQVQGRALTDGEIKFTEDVHKLLRDYELWNENHVEVPGYEHDHDHSGHDHDHDHSHGNDVQLTPKDMLETQKAFLNNIKEIKKRGEELMNRKF